LKVYTPIPIFREPSNLTEITAEKRNHLRKGLAALHRAVQGEEEMNREAAKAASKKGRKKEENLNHEDTKSTKGEIWRKQWGRVMINSRANRNPKVSSPSSLRLSDRLA